MNIDVRMYVNSDLEGVNKILKEAFNIKNVLSKYRGTGTSDKLIEYAFEVSKKIGLDYLQLTCAPFRIGGQKLYKRNGFVLRDTNVYRKEIL